MRDNDILLGIWLRAYSHLEEISDSVHRFGKSRIRSSFCPKVRLGVRLWKYPWRPNKIPCCESKAGITMILLRSDILVPY